MEAGRKELTACSYYIINKIVVICTQSQDDLTGNCIRLANFCLNLYKKDAEQLPGIDATYGSQGRKKKN